MLCRGIELGLIFVQVRWITVHIRTRQTLLPDGQTQSDIQYIGFSALHSRKESRKNELSLVSNLCSGIDSAFRFVILLTFCLSEVASRSPGWPQTCPSSTAPRISTSQVLGLHACATPDQPMWQRGLDPGPHACSVSALCPGSCRPLQSICLFNWQLSCQNEKNSYLQELS